MKYFLDQEFISGFHKPLFGKRRHFIDLISIGIVCEDGREYYAISNEFKSRDADKWVKENVIAKLEDKKTMRSGHITPTMLRSGFIWKSNDEIKRDLLTFFGCWRDQHFWRAPEGIEVYGYYADYDWVLFCSLFGRMIDLPKGFPMYCNDLKQYLDHRVNDDLFLFSKRLKYDVVDTTTKQYTKEERLNKVKAHPSFPKQVNEHNALSDAKWNYDLYMFLQTQ